MTKETTTQIQEKEMVRRSEDLLQVYKTLAFDLPVTSLRWAFGAANDKESTTAVWKGYDAGVRLATSTVDSFYRSQSLSEIVGTTVNQMLRLQQLTNAVNNFFVTSLWKPLVPPVVPGVQTRATQGQALDARLSELPSTRTHTVVSRRAPKRRVRTQKPVPTQVHSLSQEDSLQAAA